MGMTTLCYIEKDNKYLMLHRIKKEHDIGGHFEHGESPEDCMFREVMEETGLTPLSYRFCGIVTFLSDMGTEKEAWEYMCLYHIEEFKGEIKECDEGVLEWVDKEKILYLDLWEGDRLFLRYMQERRPFFSLKLEYKGDKLKIDKHTILILEGIHALNPELTPHIPEENKFKIYVSALTTISLDDHNWIPTTDNRLLRRIIRDFNYRGYSAQDTISRWPSVRAGEDKWIFPYQENADVMFNSALLFEFAVLRLHAEPILMGVPRNCPEYCEAYRLLKFIKYFIPVQDKEIPPTSLLREFLGGSSFKY